MAKDKIFIQMYYSQTFSVSEEELQDMIEEGVCELDENGHIQYIDNMYEFRKEDRHSLELDHVEYRQYDQMERPAESILINNGECD